MKLITIAAMVALLFGVNLQGQTSARLAREVAEELALAMGRRAGAETVDVLGSRLLSYARRYGDDALFAVRKVGPAAFRILDDAGENGPLAASLLARHGTRAAGLAVDKAGLDLVAGFGEAAAGALIRHPGAAQPILAEFGREAAPVLVQLSGQSARRLAIMTEKGLLRRMGRSEDVFAVIGRFGDAAATFIWRHKGALTVASVLASFLADPEAFIHGTRDLAEVAVQPVSHAAGQFAKEAGARNGWVVALIAGLATVIVWSALRTIRKPSRPAPKRPRTSGSSTEAIAKQPRKSID